VTATARALIVVGVVAAATAPAAAQPSIMSPGPLSQVHATIDGDDHCGKCHQSGKQVVASLCLDCHKDLDARLAAGAGLHGREYKGQACEHCHVEHIGRRSKLVRWPGGSMDKLDHGKTGWTLEGDHQAVKCLDCHKATTPLGRTKFIGTSAACGSCHKDPHAGSFGTDCRGCHDVADWKNFDQQKFDHDLTRYKLTGKHDDVACDGCHGTPPNWKPLQFSTCDACHADPHKGEFAPKPCARCHDTRGWDRATGKFRDNHPGVSLKNGHKRVKCETCHDRGNTKSPSKGDDCVDCHKVVHEAKFGAKCEGCHKDILWLGLPDEVGRKAHDKTPYPLAGEHADVACAACHPAAKPPPQRFRQLAFDRCTGCHADPHKGEFAARDQGECAPCHAVAGFAPTTFGLDLHATTRFALDGKHVAVACTGCHPGSRPRLDLRVPGKQACADCHQNPHGDQFAAELARGGCASCHATTDWHQPKIDHSTWPLTGAHARTACTGCHGATKANAEPAAYRGIPRDCEGCHDDIHAGQFRTAPARGCADCHDTTKYELPGFDHAARAGYALDGKHAAAKCAACHPKVELRNGASAVRYRLGYRECRDCHANPHREGAP
jgi:hypothetical protein